MGRLADAMWLAPVLLVLDRTGSAGRAGLVLAAATLPSLVTAPLIGAWLDSHARRRSAIALHLVVLAGGLGALLAGLPAVPCAFVAGLLTPLVTGGFSSMVPALGQDARGAALDAMTYNVAKVTGPALAGGLAFAGPELGGGVAGDDRAPRRPARARAARERRRRRLARQVVADDARRDRAPGARRAAARGDADHRAR